MIPTPPADGTPAKQEKRVTLKLPDIASPRDAVNVQSALGPSSKKLLQLQMNGIRRVKRNVARRREDKDDRRRMVDLDVAYSFQVEKMEAYKTSVLSQKRSMLTSGVQLNHDEERALAHMPTEAMEAALNVSKKVSSVKRLGREMIQSSRGYDRGRDRQGMLSERSEKGQGWGKMEKYEPMSARIARGQGWDSRTIPDQVAGKLKYTLSFVNGMERSHGRPRRALDLIRRELDRDGNPHAQPPGMVNNLLSRDEQERAERETGTRQKMKGLRNNLKSFHASSDGDGTVADAMLLHDNYLEWKLDSRPTRPDEDPAEKPDLKPVPPPPPSSAKPEPPLQSRAAAMRSQRRPPSPQTQLARQIAVEVGVKTMSAKAALNKKLEDEPNWGKQTRRTMKSMGVTDGSALRGAIAAKFGDSEPTV